MNVVKLILGRVSDVTSEINWWIMIQHFLWITLSVCASRILMLNSMLPLSGQFLASGIGKLPADCEILEWHNDGSLFISGVERRCVWQHAGQAVAVRVSLVGTEFQRSSDIQPTAHIRGGRLRWFCRLFLHICHNSCHISIVLVICWNTHWAHTLETSAVRQ